jgi:hypothetical protein
MEIEEVRKEVEELYRELGRRKYERAIKKGASEQALANFLGLHEKFLSAFVEKEMKWIEIIEEEEKRRSLPFKTLASGCQTANQEEQTVAGVL